MKITKSLAVALFAVLAAFAQPGDEIPSAFQEVGQSRRAARPGSLSLRRDRDARVNLRLFDRAAAKTFRKLGPDSPAERRSVRMNLFPDVDLMVRWNKAEGVENSKNVVWTGVVEGDPLSQAILVTSDGEVTGNVVTRGKVYQIRPQNGGTHSIAELEISALPLEQEPLRTPEEPPADPAAVAEDAAAADDGSLIDVMVAFTAAALKGAGGPERMTQLIQLAVAETNQGYANSGIRHRIRLVGFGDVSYTETGNFSTELNRLSSTDDGFLDDLHAIRDRLGADIVSLWVETGDACGVGWILANPARVNAALGFNVVRRDCATGIFSFGHEIGHNLGATHAPGDTTGEGAYPYSHGFKQTARTPYFRTIMAYACPGDSCPRVNYWSSPDLTYQGSLIGTRTQHDNRTTLNNTAAVVASYRRSTVPTDGTQGGGETLPESPHPYTDNLDRTWTYSASGNPASIKVTFSPDTSVEEGWDFVVIMDGNGREIAGSPFTGDQLSNKYVIVPGGTVRIRLVSDESVGGYGFKVVDVSPASGGAIDLAAVSFAASNVGTIGGTVKGLIAKVQNLGQTEAGAFRIAFYWIDSASNATFSGWSCAVGSLGPGLSYTCSGDISVANSMKPGEYKLVVIADDERKTTDANWDNNARASEGGVVTIR